MSFTDFAKEAKKLAPQNRIGQVNPGFKPNPESMKKIIDETNYLDMFQKGAPKKEPVMIDADPGQYKAVRNSKQSVDERHCNIIKNVINEAQTGSGTPATWKSCRHYKQRDDRDFCTEFFSLCAKERCSRARR